MRRADSVGKKSYNSVNAKSGSPYRSPPPAMPDLFGANPKKKTFIIRNETSKVHEANTKKNFQHLKTAQGQIREKNEMINLPFKDRSYAMAKESVTNQEMKKLEQLTPNYT